MANKGYVTIPVGYKRVDNLPLVLDQLFTSLSDAQNYAQTDPTAYVGQIFSVIEGDTVTAYIIKNDKSLAEIGSTPISSYNDLTDKPQIGGIELTGNKTLAELGIAAASDIPSKVSELENDSKYQTESQVSTTVTNAIASLGAVFKLKGRVDSFGQLPTEGNVAGDMYLVGAEGTPDSSEYVWTSESKWEHIGDASIDLSNYVTKTDADADYAAKADGITAEERQKVAKIIINGTGTKVLSDNGTYIELPTPETGVDNYNQLKGLPKINGVVLAGTTEEAADGMTSAELGIKAITTELGEVTEGQGITVQLGAGATIGGYKTGDVIAPTTMISEILQKLLVKQVPPTYTKPTASLQGTGTTPVEAGTKQTISLNPSYTKNDGGDVTSYTLKKGSEVILDAVEALENHQITDFVVPEGTTNFSAIIAYAQGPVKKDNLGQDYPTGQIPAGQLTPSKSYVGQRKMFWGSDTNAIEATTSAQIRALANNKLNPQKGTVTPIATGEGTKYIVIAYPASLGDVASIMQSSTNLDVKGSFAKTTVDVEGADGYTAVSYNVYIYTAAIGLNADTFTVTI